jgi:hypothetical protein
MDYWITGLLDCWIVANQRVMQKNTILEKSEMPIPKFFLISNIYGFS